MPIKVFAKLNRDSAVYLAGEAISCKVTVQNVGTEANESLAWGSVHLQCERIMRADVFDEFPKNSVEKSGEATAMSRSAYTVFSCRPVILFCDLQLSLGEHREFECTQQLPLDSIPPSFKGHLVKYIYMLTLGVQHVKSPIKLIKIPLRVVQADLGISLPPYPSSSNPFLANQNYGPSIIDLATEMTDSLTAPHGIRNYAITNVKGLVTNFLLYKTAFKLGEDIIGRFNFDSCIVKCLQLAVTLQCIESLVGDESNSRKHVHNFMTESIVCAFWEDAIVKLQIPLTATPSFETDTVKLTWCLHFEFVTCEDLKFEAEESSMLAPSNLNIETMVWDLDIQVFPCNPHNAALTSAEAASDFSIIV